MKEKFSNDIIVYEMFKTRQQLFEIAKKYSLWDKSENIVIKILENEWMSITLKFDVKIETAKMYSMSSKERELINETFDKLHNQEKMHWIKKFTAHEALVFVIWRQMSDDERKKRVVINIRDLNKIVEFDSYSMFFQTNIINAVTDAKYISMIDAAAFFYQFRVKIADRHKLIVISHREQKYFFVASMNFKNSFAYA